MITRVHFIRKSSNSKTGPIPVSYTSSNSCPDSCPLIDAGCYASAGYYTNLNWKKVDRGERGTDWVSFCTKVSDLEAGTLWRHNIAGDLPHKNGIINRGRMSLLTRANEGKRGFTYTHHDPALENNAATIKTANDNGFTINLSANSPKQADQLIALGIAPVVTILPSNQMENTTTPAGNAIVVCPAVTHPDVTCKTCGLCQNKRRYRGYDQPIIIGFPAHGAGKARAQGIE